METNHNEMEEYLSPEAAQSYERAVIEILYGEQLDAVRQSIAALAAFNRELKDN